MKNKFNGRKIIEMSSSPSLISEIVCVPEHHVHGVGAEDQECQVNVPPHLQVIHTSTQGLWAGLKY